MEVKHSALFSTMEYYRQVALNANTTFLDKRREEESGYTEVIESLKEELDVISNKAYQSFDDSDKIDQLNKEIEFQTKMMTEKDKLLCLEYEDTYRYLFDEQELWLTLAPFAQTTESDDVGCFSFQCNNIERRLRLFIQAIAHDNTPNNLTNHLAFFIPEVLAKKEVLKHLVGALNNPIPNKSHKYFSRYISAIEAQNKYSTEYLFNFDTARKIIVEFLEQVKAGAKFNTGNEELDKSANYASQKAQEKATWLLTLINTDVKGHLQNNFSYNPSDFWTDNAKGGSRVCKPSEVQKKLFRIFNLSVNKKIQKVFETEMAA